MQTGTLLDELINIAQKSKTDFALNMNMTPSGLSKILTNKRLPFQKEKKLFIKQAANYFAEAIYSYKCYIKFEKIFPVIYDFSSKYELELFLAHAIEYCLDRDYAVENSERFDHPDRGMAYISSKAVINMLCILVSDFLRNSQESPYEFYSTLPLFNKYYSDIFSRVRIISHKKRAGFSFHHFFNMSEFESSCNHLHVLSVIVNMQQHGDLNLWTTQEAVTHHFLLLKGQFLLLFAIQLDGTPIMTVITHKSYIVAFYNSLMEKKVKKISLTRSEAIAALEANPSYIDKLMDRGINAVYNFISIGYLVKKEDLDKIEGSDTIKTIMLRIFQNILTKKTSFFVTVDAMMGFYATGKAIIPLLGAVDIAPEERIDYLLRFNSYISDEQTEKVTILTCEMPKAAVFCSPGLNVIYSIDSEYDSEKIHFFETDMMHASLAGEIANGNLKTLSFSPDLWATYIDDLSSK